MKVGCLLKSYKYTLTLEGDGVAKLVVRLGPNLDISQKYKMGDISKGVPNTLARQKIYILVQYCQLNLSLSTVFFSNSTLNNMWKEILEISTLTLCVTLIQMRNHRGVCTPRK